MSSYKLLAAPKLTGRTGGAITLTSTLTLTLTLTLPRCFGRGGARRHGDVTVHEVAYSEPNPTSNPNPSPINEYPNSGGLLGS